MTHTSLKAWGRPLSQFNVPIVKNLDHTWVTDFDVEVDPQKQPDPPDDWEPPLRYWYCWGRTHEIASHALGAKLGETDTANAISPQNTPAVETGKSQYEPSATSGSIVYYGLDGVCHMVANQVLCATGTPDTEPLRVKQAKGYSVSTFLFTTYGLNTALWEDIKSKHLAGVKLPEDDFLSHMKKVVPLGKQEKLLQIRDEAQSDIRALRTEVEGQDGYDYFFKLFKITEKSLRKVLRLLGWAGFKKLFPDSEATDVTWLHPEGTLSPSAMQFLAARS